MNDHQLIEFPMVVYMCAKNNYEGWMAVDKLTGIIG